MNIQATKTAPKLCFRGYGGTSQNINSQNKMDICIHESHFMRNLDSLAFAADYIQDAFPEGTHIADFGCSAGEEAYSLGVLLHSSNHNKQYKITGYDIVHDVVEDAKKGVFNIGDWEDNYEKFLVGNRLVLSPQEQSTKKAFEDCFRKIPPKWNDFNIDHPRYKAKVKRYLEPEQTLELTTKRLEYIHQPNSRRKFGGEDFIPKEGVFEDIINFKVADIASIDRILEPKKTGMVIFKNSLYHLLGSRTSDGYNGIDIKPAKDLFKKINSILPEGGLFVLGILSHDHLKEENLHSSQYRQHYQKNDQIKVFDSSRIHAALRESGFEPVFYECERDSKGRLVKSEVHLPSVWKKLSKA